MRILRALRSIQIVLIEQLNFCASASVGAAKLGLLLYYLYDASRITGNPRPAATRAEEHKMFGTAVIIFGRYPIRRCTNSK